MHGLGRTTHHWQFHLQSQSHGDAVPCKQTKRIDIHEPQSTDLRRASELTRTASPSIIGTTGLRNQSCTRDPTRLLPRLRNMHQQQNRDETADHCPSELR